MTKKSGLENLRTLINSRRDEVVQQIVAYTAVEPEPGVTAAPRTDIAQMVNGFVVLLAAALDGQDQEIRAFYLETVMPGLRDSGTPLATMIGGSAQTLLRLTAHLATMLPADEREPAVAWLATYLGDYLAAIVRIWEAKP